MKNEIKIKSIKYNLAMNILLKISQVIFPLITLPYVTRVLGAVNNGKIAFVSSIISYFSIFAQLGIPTYGIRICAQCRDDREKLSKTVQEIIFINAFAVIISYVALLISYLSSEKLKSDPILLFVFSTSIILTSFGMDWFYQAIEQYQYITVRNMFFKFLSLILLFFFIHNPNDYILYGAISVLSAAGSNILNIWNSRKYLNFKRYHDYKLHFHLKPILTFFALSISVSIYTNMDTVMLGFLSNDIQVAYYNLATKIKQVLAQMISALGPVILPRVSYYLSKGDKESFNELIRKSFRVVIIVSLPITIYFFVMASQTIFILGGNEYKDAIGCMRIIMLALLPLGIGNIACMQILAPMGREKYTMYSTICGAFINLVTNIILIPDYGASGAAFATVLTEIIVACIQVYYARDVLIKIIKNESYGNIIISCLCSGFILFIIRTYIFSETAILQILITFLIFMTMYICFLLILKERLIINFIRYYFEKN